MLDRGLRCGDNGGIQKRVKFDCLVFKHAAHTNEGQRPVTKKKAYNRLHDIGNILLAISIFLTA